MTCTECKTDGHSRLRSLGNDKWVCRGCISYVPREEAGKILHYEYIEGYGKVLKSRIREMERRVIIDAPGSKTDYFCGRLGENGKIQERSPNYGG